MPLFGRKRDKVNLSLDDPFVALAIDQAAGTAFAQAIKRGELPPTAFLWINRYANQVPVLRCEETTEAWATYEDHGPMRARGALIALLATIAAEGADLPTILAAENSVTLTLTLETIRAAASIVLANPEAAREKWGGDQLLDTGLQYREGQDQTEWLVCELLRDGMQRQVERGLTLASFRRGEMELRRPDLVVQFALTEFDRLASELRGTFAEGPQPFALTQFDRLALEVGDTLFAEGPKPLE